MDTITLDAQAAQNNEAVIDLPNGDNFICDDISLLPDAIYHASQLIEQALEQKQVVLLCNTTDEVDSYTLLKIPAIAASHGDWTDNHSNALYREGFDRNICIVTNNAKWLHKVAGSLVNSYCQDPMFIEPEPNGNLYENHARANNLGHPPPVYKWGEREAELRDCRFKPTPYVHIPSSELPRPDFIYGKHYIRGEISLTTSSPSVGKSFLMITEALAMVTGRNLLGVDVDSPKRVWIWGEDFAHSTYTRLHGLYLQYNIDGRPLSERLFIDSFRDNPMNLIQSVKGQIEVNTKQVETLAKWVRMQGIDVIVIDTLVHVHTANENDNGQMHTVCEALKLLAYKGNCAVEIIHHNRKGIGSEPNLDSGRGAGAIAAMVRSARVLTAMTEDEGVKAGVDNYDDYFRANSTKATFTAGSSYSEWFRFSNHDLDNGYNVGALTKWKWPDAFDGLDQEVMDRFLEALRAAPMKAHYQARDWAGNTLGEYMGLDMSDPFHKSQVKRILKEWLKNGVICETKIKDDNRLLKPHYTVNEAKLS